MGVPDEWLQKFEKVQPYRRSVLSVRRLVAGTAAATVLFEGDIILTANGQLVRGYHDLDCELVANAVAMVRFCCFVSFCRRVSSFANRTLYAKAGFCKWTCRQCRWRLVKLTESLDVLASFCKNLTAPSCSNAATYPASSTARTGTMARLHTCMTCAQPSLSSRSTASTSLISRAFCE